MLGLLRPGGLLTMPNWFLLIGAADRTAAQRLGAVRRADLGQRRSQLRRTLAARTDLAMSWVIRPPLGVAVKVR